MTGADYFVLEPPRLIASPALKVSWRWFFEGHEISVNDTHYISADGSLIVLQAANRFGTYQLKADSEKGSTFSEKYAVDEDTEYAPRPEFTIVLRPQDVVVNAADFPSATFECVPSLSGRYPAEVKWLLNGEPLVIDGREVRTENSNRRLVIRNVVSLIGKSVHTARVRCEARTGDENLMEYAEAHLEVIEVPDINKESLPSEISVRVGDPVKLLCKTTKAWPRAKFAWYFNKDKVNNGLSFPFDLFFQVSGSSSEVLKIDHLEKTQYGVYQCRASNLAGTDFAQVWIKADGRQFANFLTHLNNQLVAQIDHLFGHFKNYPFCRWSYGKQIRKWGAAGDCRKASGHYCNFWKRRDSAVCDGGPPQHRTFLDS